MPGIVAHTCIIFGVKNLELPYPTSVSLALCDSALIRRLVNMSVESGARHDDKRQDILQSTPNVQIFLKPIAPPAALGLAGFAGSTWITSSYIADWWGGPESPTIFFPFVGIFGGLAQFIAGIYGFQARDTLVTVINTLWGSFWIAIGILYAFVVRSGLSVFPSSASAC